MDKELETRQFFPGCKQVFSISLFSFYTAIAIETSTSAAIPVAKLNNWRFSPKAQQLEITLSAATTPRYFYLAQPPRIVVDLPDTKLGHVATQQNYSGAIQRIRVSQLTASVTRIVLDLAPSTVFNPKQLQLQPVSRNNPTRWVLHPVVASSNTSIKPKYSAPSSNQLLQTPYNYQQPTTNLPQSQYNYLQPSSNLPSTTNTEQSSFLVLPPPSNLPAINTNSQQPFVTVPPLTSNEPSQSPSSILPPPTFPSQLNNLNNTSPVKPDLPIPTAPEVSPNVPNVQVIEFGQPLPQSK